MISIKCWKYKVVIIIKHLQMNQILVLNNLQVVNMPNKPNQKVEWITKLMNNVYLFTIIFCGHESETNGSSWQKRVRLCLACRAVIWYEGRNAAITVWKERKILTTVSIIHLQPILKEKKEEAPTGIFIG